ncbi:hypothetical protein M8994_19915 [Brucella sp. 21LCYQ03]|nr:hypothetical protein [Brucella sp. 21LCYQ03]
MPSTTTKTLEQRFIALSKMLRTEQRRLLEEAAISDGLPSNSLLKQVAELELNIAAVENNLAEMK